MKFIVSRNSDCENKKPCKGALLENEKWFIEINSIENLMAFTKVHGQIILSESWEGFNSIEIYDDCRE